jgi:hypothetical protein
MLGPLITPGSRFLELLVIVDAWSFNSLLELQLPPGADAV